MGYTSGKLLLIARALIGDCGAQGECSMCSLSLTLFCLIPHSHWAWELDL